MGGPKRTAKPCNAFYQPFIIQAEGAHVHRKRLIDGRGGDGGGVPVLKVGIHDAHPVIAHAEHQKPDHAIVLLKHLDAEIKKSGGD